MKTTYWIKLTAIILLLILVIVSPYLPGPPNKIVVVLSSMAQSAGFFGLLLLPVGLIWAIVELRRSRKINNERPGWKVPYILAIIALVIITGNYLLLLVAGMSLGLGTLSALLIFIAGAFGFTTAVRGIKKLKTNPAIKMNPMPFYLLSIPLIALIANNFLVRPVSDYSREYAIEKSRHLIASIEEYKIKNGEYPKSVKELESHYLKKISNPFIMGIENFRYNKINGFYSISFSQWLNWGAVEEIVLYDKNNLRNDLKGRHAIYDYIFDLCRVKGAFAVYKTRYDDWQYYLID